MSDEIRKLRLLLEVERICLIAEMIWLTAGNTVVLVFTLTGRPFSSILLVMAVTLLFGLTGDFLREWFLAHMRRRMGRDIRA